ncbi:MAG: flagellar biosynthesis protein FlhF [bacterium]
MRIKKFEGATLQEALFKVKKDFGSEAVILHTKKYKRGAIFGLFGQNITEVTAGIDINIQASVKTAAPSGETQTATNPAILSQKKQKGGSDKNKQPFQSHQRTEDLGFKNEALLRELNEGKVSVSATIKSPKEMSGGLALKDGLGRIQKILLENGVEENIVYRILQNANSQLTEAQLNNKIFMDQYMSEYIANMVKTAGPIKTIPGAVKLVVFIGPTGVGKTTTIAKLAAKYTLLENKKVVLVGADNYRIAADLQLKKYGDIIDIPIEIISTPQDLKKVIKKHTDKDLILLDTAGRSPRNKKHLAELKDFLDVYSPVEIHLVISAVTKYYDAVGIINNFGLVPIHRLLFTKLDETKNYGMLLNLSVNSGGIPISYLTIGQMVPDDLEVADPKVISRLVLKGDFETWIRQRV